MNLRRLEYFLTIAQTGSLRQASEILNISSPALSKAMKVLEDELETDLWIADGRRIILTDAGKALFRRAPDLISNLKDLKDSLNSKAPTRELVRIGTFEVFSTYFLTVLENLSWDNHSLELHELLPGEIEKYVVQGDLDLGITYMPIPDPQLDFLKVASVELGVYIKKGAFKGVAQEDLPFVVPVMPLQGVPTRIRGLDGWPEDAFQRKVVHRVTLMESALELCRQGRVAGYFPVFIVDEQNKRMCAKYQLERQRSPRNPNCKVRNANVYIVKRKSSSESLVIKQLARVVRQICKP